MSNDTGVVTVEAIREMIEDLRRADTPDEILERERLARLYGGTE